jgi:hypothetical protein
MPVFTDDNIAGPNGEKAVVAVLRPLTPPDARITHHSESGMASTLPPFRQVEGQLRPGLRRQHSACE